MILSDGANVYHALVKDGWCWWYRKYAPRNTVLGGLEKGARGARKGLWADPQPVCAVGVAETAQGVFLDNLSLSLTPHHARPSR
ncbi:MAG: thermonuclease family protein [Nitrospirae bacterium]|nr:thermonuclease family protein [Nitrospirota bacterium]